MADRASLCLHVNCYLLLISAFSKRAQMSQKGRGLKRRMRALERERARAHFVRQQPCENVQNTMPRSVLGEAVLSIAAF